MWHRSEYRGGAVAARQAHNLEVAGSIPAPVIFFTQNSFHSPMLETLRMLQPLSLLVMPLWLIYLTYEIIHIRKRNRLEASNEPTGADQALEAKLSLRMDAVRAETQAEITRVYKDLAENAKSHGKAIQEHLDRVSGTLTQLAKELGEVSGAVSILAKRR